MGDYKNYSRLLMSPCNIRLYITYDILIAKYLLYELKYGVDVWLYWLEKSMVHSLRSVFCRLLQRWLYYSWKNGFKWKGDLSKELKYTTSQFCKLNHDLYNH